MTATTARPRLGGADIVFLVLLVFVPATVVAAWLHAGTWVFVLAALALIPLRAVDWDGDRGGGRTRSGPGWEGC